MVFHCFCEPVSRFQCFFFFQADDGIRDLYVTGVQTCALPICEDLARQALERKSAVQQQLQGLDGQIKQLEAQQQRLVASEQQLSARVEAFRSEKEVIKAQYSAAEA